MPGELTEEQGDQCCRGGMMWKRSVGKRVSDSQDRTGSYGVTSTMSYADAQKRCASYQEDGYPAGRWRVPTRAEIMYMVMLAKDGKIPVLLSNSGWYWGSDKKAYCPGNFDNPRTNDSNVRCVYDEWYWTDKLSDDKKDTFYWGDKERVKTE